LIKQAIDSLRDSAFRSKFPVGSHKGEKDIILRVMRPSDRFPAVLIREGVFSFYEVASLIRQALDSHSNVSFRSKFPLESLQGEQDVLSALSPYDRSLYNQRSLISPQDRLRRWHALLDSYNNPAFVQSLQKESIKGKSFSLIRMGWISLFELAQPKQALSFLRKGKDFAKEADEYFLTFDSLKLITSTGQCEVF
jgi:hypothetical protein